MAYTCYGSAAAMQRKKACAFQGARRVSFGARRAHLGGPCPSVSAAPEIAVFLSKPEGSGTNLAARPAGVAMLRMLARILRGRARNRPIIGSEPSAAMWRGKMGRSKVARFTADFFAAEIRAWRPAKRHHGASGAAGLVLPFSSRFLTGNSSPGWSFFYWTALGGGISL